VTTTVYDAQGNPQTLSVQFNKTAADTWTATISATGSVSPQANPVTLQIKFGDGTTTAPDGSTPAAGTLESITDISSPANTTAPTISTDTAGAAADVGLTFNFGGKNQAVSLDLGTWGGSSGLTSYSGSDVSVTSETQNGYTSGTVSGISIDTSGYINVAYTNGETAKVAQVAVAQFADADGLTSVNGTAFQQSLDSGTPVTNTATEGQIAPSELEQSTVSLSNELTKMITAQQVYTSNARVVTTADQMLQTLTQMIQG
jgi:flagellar hook protein FlgE